MGRPKKVPDGAPKSNLNAADLAVIAQVVKQVLQNSLVVNASGAVEPAQQIEETSVEEIEVFKKPRLKKLPKIEESQDDEDVEETSHPKKRGRPPKKEKKGKGIAARREAFRRTKNRPNLFLTMPEFNQFKNDTKTDKKLWGENKPVTRKSEANLVEIECAECGRILVISPSLIADPEYYVCDKCVPKGE
jgi:hypothetical protein